MAKFQKHVFICGNQRDPEAPRGSCDPTAKGDLQKAFKDRLTELGLKRTIRANKSGCLDQCEHGPSVVVYPEAVWYGRVQLSDVEEIIQSHLVGGVPVARLVLPEECINTRECPHKPKTKSA
jgi:(2Fe-2S) ferredoxin